MGSEYSNLKMAWHMMRDGGLPKSPKQVEIILSDLCNQDCNFCAYRMSGYTSNEMFVEDSPLASFGTNNPKRMIPTKRALDLLDECGRLGALGIQFTGGGEPTVHPAHEEIFWAALEHGFHCALVSNGFRWSDLLMQEILPQFAWVRVSVDAGSADTYALVRRTSPRAYERVLDNISTLAAALKRKESKCLLGVGYVVTPENAHEILEGCRRAKETGARYVRLSAVFSTEDEKPYLQSNGFSTLYGRIKMAISEAKRALEDDTFTIHDLFKDRVQDLVDKAPDYDTCAYQYATTYVGGDLNVYRCCVLAYNHRGLVGSVKDKTLDEFWNSEERRKDFENFKARECQRCQFNEKNRMANYLLNKAPTHVEFP